MSASKLVRPSIEYKESYLQALAEYHAEGRFLHLSTALLSSETGFSSHVKNLNTERGAAHRPYQEWVNEVPETVVWLVKNDQYLGTAFIRHRLNWHLERWGGHIHFIVRPSMRGKGFGKKILLKTIPVANYLGIERALLTVAPDNKAAIRVIESCGGTLEDELPETDQFPARLRYWINCN